MIERIEHLHDKAIPRVKLMVVDLELPATRAVSYLGVGLLPVFLYLVSTSGALKKVSGSETNPAKDWIFFHPGCLGPSLGMLWVSCIPMVGSPTLNGVYIPA